MKTNLFAYGFLAVSAIAIVTPCEAQYSGYQQPPGYPQQITPPPQQGYPQSYPAQGGYSQPPQNQYVSPMQFLPTFGRKFGDMFRRVFYGDSPPAGYQPQYQQPQYQQQPSRGLEQTPSPAQYQQAPNQGYPRYETPPPTIGTAPTPAPTNRLNSGTPNSSTSTKRKTSPSATPKTQKSSSKYTPPAITRQPVSPEPEEEPPALNSDYQNTGSPSKLPGSKPSSNQVGSSKPESTEKPNATANGGSFLRGKKAGKEGHVISPYPPYRELDVSGLSSGSLALDPTTQKVFEVP